MLIKQEFKNKGVSMFFSDIMDDNTLEIIVQDEDDCITMYLPKEKIKEVISQLEYDLSMMNK